MAKKLMVLLGILAVMLAAAVPALAQQQDETTVPAGATGESTVPDTTAPESTTPETTTPESITPDTTTPATGTGDSSGNDLKKVTQTFELTVKGDPPAGASFFGRIIPPAGAGSGPLNVLLTDPDGDGTYTGSNFVNIPATPVDSPPNSVNHPPTIQIVQSTGFSGPEAANGCSFNGCMPGEPISVIKDFGVVPLDADKTFSARVNFNKGDQGGTTTPESTTPESTTPESTVPETTTPESTTPDTTTPATGTGSSSGNGGSASGSSGNGGGNAARGGNGGGNAANGTGGSQGGVSGAVSDAFGNVGRGSLPDTGGGWVVLLLAAVVLIGGGWLLVRRFSPFVR